MRSKPSVSTALSIQVSVFSVLSILILGAIWVYGEFHALQTNTERDLAVYEKQHKQSLKDIVDQAVNYVNYMRAQVEDRTRTSLKLHVDQAHAIATHLHETLSTTLSEEEVRAQIRETLRAIRFENGRGYIFLMDDSGSLVLHPILPQLEGVKSNPQSDDPLVRSAAVVFSSVAKHDEGFSSYQWMKEGYPADQMFDKISYLRKFEPLGWWIGAGDYVDEVEKSVQTEALDWLSSITHGNGGTIFVSQWDGVALTEPGKGNNNWELVDAKGVKVVQEVVKVSRKGRGFVDYSMPDLGDGKNFHKIAYVAGIPEWEWSIGAAQSMKPIELALAAREQAARKTLTENVLKFTGFVLVLVALLLLAIRRVAKKTQKSHRTFAAFLDEAARGSATIDPDAMAFDEFESLARSANRMIEARQVAEEDLKKAVAEAEKANAAKSQFLANMSHELRTPLNSIIGFSELILSETFGAMSVKYREYLTLIHESGERLLDLINDILDLEKIGSGKITLRESDVRLSDVVREIVEMAEPSAEKNNVTLIAPHNTKMPNIRADRMRVEQVLLNLVSNAIKFTPNGTVTITTALNDGAVSVYVTDTGLGMSKEDIDIAFTAFGQVDSHHMTRQYGGTGLGLPIAQKLTELHGGTLHIDSTIGEGTTVTVSFPAERTLP